MSPNTDPGRDPPSSSGSTDESGDSRRPGDADGDGDGVGDRTATRRRFLRATATASVTAALAGCNGSGDGETTRPTDGTTTAPSTTDPPATGTPTPTETTTATPDSPFGFEGYPYGVGESRVEAARKVMEDAGYGPDDPFELNWYQYHHRPLNEMGQALRNRLDAAHVELKVVWDCGFGPPCRENVKRGETGAYSLGWVADYPAPKNFLRLVYPPNTNYRGEDPDATGAYVYWTPDSDHGGGRQRALEAFERIESSPEPSDRARRVRATAVREFEEALWADVPLVATRHGVAEPVWHDRVDWTPHGALGSARQKKNDVSVSGRDRLRLVDATITTLDPIECTDPAGGTVVTQVFDGLTVYRNGTTSVDPLLVADYEVSDDFTTYRFRLKEGVQFHGGYGEVTAGDIVYSLRRLAESPHSNRSEYVLDVLGVVHESETTERGTRAVPGTLGVRATGTYEVEIDLEAPFPHTLAMLAFRSFSVVPEGIVGDVEGYDGELARGEFATNPVGCGPFAFGEWTQGERASVDRFEDYHGGIADIVGIDWTVVEDDRASYRHFLKGKADIAGVPTVAGGAFFTGGGVPTTRYDPEKVTVVRTDDRGRQLGTYGPTENGTTVNYARIPQLSTFYVGFNCEGVPLPVRRAFAYVVNMESLLEEFFGGRPVPAYHLTPPNLFPGGYEGYVRHYRDGE